MIDHSIKLHFIAFLALIPAISLSQSYSVYYAFDAQGRLTAATYNNLDTITYSYDEVGNMSRRIVEVVDPTKLASDENLPEKFSLHTNYPNPFNPATTIRFDLPERSEVRVEIYDVLGRRVLTIPAIIVEGGFSRKLPLNASRLASGLYIYRVTAQTLAGSVSQTDRMMLIK